MKNAGQILKASNKDIKAGRWNTGALGSCTRGPNNCELMGCALGLVSIHGDDITKIVKKNVAFTNSAYPGFTQMVPLQFVVPKYANAKSPKAVVKAIAALALAAGINDRGGFDAGDAIDRLNNAVYQYNDHLKGGGTEAAKWFDRAIKLLPTVKLPKVIENNYKTKAKVAA